MEKIKSFILMIIAIVLAVLFTLLCAGIQCIGTQSNCTESINQYLIDAAHTLLFIGCLLSFIYTIYLSGCAYFHILREIRRSEITNNIKQIPVPEAILKKPLCWGIITAVLYVIQSYFYSYTIYY